MKKMLKYFVVLLTALFPATVFAQSSTYQTTHDTIPNFVYLAPISAVADGLASDPATWNCNCVPTPADKVIVDSPRVVNVDTLDVHSVGGTGILNMLDSGYLRVVNVQFANGGKLTGGSPAAPISSEVVIRDVVPEASDTQKFGTGGTIINGTLDLHGHPKVPFVNLGYEPLAGAVIMQIVPPQGWAVGDKLVIPDTRETRTGTSQTEEVTITELGVDNITFTPALAYDHLGARDYTNTLLFTPDVANLSRSIVIRSENPAGTRGHVLVTGTSEMRLSYVEFSDLGRTTVANLGSANPAGRYPLHAHHMIETAASDVQVVGIAISGCKKWCAAIHGSHYQEWTDNIFDDADGGGFVTEDGSETGNSILRNLALRIRGVGDIPDINGREGSGFWFRAQQNDVRDNVAADTRWAGFMVWEKNGNIGSALNMNVPLKKGGTRVQWNVRQLPFVAFTGNRAYATDRGFETWYAFSTVLDNFDAWHNKTAHLFLYYGIDAQVEDVVAVGDGGTVDCIQVRQPLSLMLRNTELQGCLTGFRNKSNKKSIVIENVLWRNNTADLVMNAPDEVLLKPEQFINNDFVSGVVTGTWDYGSSSIVPGAYVHPYTAGLNLVPGGVYSGTVALAPTVTPTVTGGRAQVYISGKKVVDDYSEPYAGTWNTTTYPNGPHWVIVEIKQNVAGSWPMVEYISFLVYVQN